MNARLSGLDRYLRRRITAVAIILRLLSPVEGKRYTTSRTKRALDVAIGVPALTIAGVPMLLLLLLNKLLHPSLPVFFVQERVGHDRGMHIMKIRSMVSGAPGLTGFGRFMRRHKLDELPQVVQVLSGELSLVGIRVLPYEIYEELGSAWSEQRFARWREAYTTTPLGLTGIHQIMRGVAKEDRARFHRDMFYARHATLGLDLYLLWRTALRMLNPPSRKRVGVRAIR